MCACLYCAGGHQDGAAAVRRAPVCAQRTAVRDVQEEVAAVQAAGTSAELRPLNVCHVSMLPDAHVGMVCSSACFHSLRPAPLSPPTTHSPPPPCSLPSPRRPCAPTQIVCLQLSDTVPFRCHWPLSSDLRVNGMAYRVFARQVTPRAPTPCAPRLLPALHSPLSLSPLTPHAMQPRGLLLGGGVLTLNPSFVRCWHCTALLNCNWAESLARVPSGMCDSVTFRTHARAPPLPSTLQGHLKLGANQRDETANIGVLCNQGGCAAACHTP
jgi:hypothetical protein